MTNLRVCLWCRSCICGETRVHLCSMRSILCRRADDIYEATCYVVSFLLSVFAHGAFFLACCSHSDSAACPLCFLGSARSALLASHLMRRDEARTPTYPLFTKSSQRRSLSPHTTTNISQLFFVVFSFIFWSQGRPTVSLPFLYCICKKTTSIWGLFYVCSLLLLLFYFCSTVKWLKGFNV